MADKLQSMMAPFRERNKAARGRQEDILRMLREFADDIQAGVHRADERDERLAKKNGKGKKNGDVSAPSPRAGQPAEAEVQASKPGGEDVPSDSIQVSAASQPVLGSGPSE